MEEFKVGLLQMSSGEDVAANLSFIQTHFENLRQKENPQLVVTPENSLFMRIRKSTPVHRFQLNDPEIKQLQDMVDQGKTHLILGSIPLVALEDPSSESARLRNAMVLLSPGRAPEVVYDKIHLFDVDVEGQPPVRESEVFQPGTGPEVLELDGFKFGLSICYDLRFAELYGQYAKQEVDGILVPSAFLVPTGEAHWEVLLRARAIESQCYCLAPAQGGRSIAGRGPEGADEAFRETYGHSLAVDPWGKVLLELDPQNPAGVVKLERAKMKKVRGQIPMKGHRRL